MNGAIKLATLSDTDDTDVTGAELVTNGTFDSDLTGWNTSAGTVTWNSGTMRLTNTTQYGTEPSQTITGLTVGSQYVLTFDKANVSGDGSWYISDLQSTTSAAGTFTYTITATSTSYNIIIKKRYVGTISIDNVSFRLAEEDRSVNGNGLQVFGSITKTAVATGADLVGYSGFSSGNYLQQPYNADLDFGTGDFCYMGWVKTSTSAGKDVWIQRTDGGTAWGTNATVIMQHTSGEFLVQAGGQWAVTSGASINDGQWHFVTVVRSNGVVNAYWDTQSKLTFTGAAAQANGDDTVVLGVGKYGGGLADAHGGSLALLRISATAPSPEQIAKIYNDEKHLFK
jgi:hypothetical protein